MLLGKEVSGTKGGDGAQGPLWVQQGQESALGTTLHLREPLSNPCSSTPPGLV